MSELGPFDIDSLTAVATTAFEWTVAVGQSFQPKLLMGTDHGVDTAGYDSTSLLPILAARLAGTVQWAVSTNDAYEFIGPDESWDEVKDKRLADLFAAGDPRVTEALIVTAVWSGGFTVATMPYTRNGTTVEWGERRIVSSDTIGVESSGRVIEALRVMVGV